MWMRYNIKLVTCLTFNIHLNTHLLRIRFDNIFFNGPIVPLLLPDQRVCRLVDQYFFFTKYMANNFRFSSNKIYDSSCYAYIFILQNCIIFQMNYIDEHLECLDAKPAYEEDFIP